MNRKFIMPYIWDLSEDEIAEVENAELGSSVHIEGSPIPAIFEDEDVECLYVFTSMDTLPEDFRQEYAIEEHSMNYIYALMCAIEKVLGKEIMLSIDPFADEGDHILTKEQVRKLL